MVDFAFYRDTYLGSRIPEKQFAACASRAKDALGAFRRCYTVKGGEVEEKMALCAMAEAVYTAFCRGNVVSATTGSVSVRYGEPEGRLWRELYERCRIYLDIYRGVS